MCSFLASFVILNLATLWIWRLLSQCGLRYVQPSSSIIDKFINLESWECAISSPSLIISNPIHNWNAKEATIFILFYWSTCSFSGKFFVRASRKPWWCVFFCPDRLIKIKEWVDKNDPGSLIIPFSGAFEHKLVEEYEDAALRKKFLEDMNTTRWIWTANCRSCLISCDVRLCYGRDYRHAISMPFQKTEVCGIRE